MYKITDLTRSGAAGGDYPFGYLQDNPGGTLVDLKMVQDLLVNIQKAANLAGITPNSTPDNESNGYQLLQSLLNLDAVTLDAAGDWVSGGTLSVNAVGATVSVGSTNYNKYKLIGKTFIWQVSFALTVSSGSPTEILVDYPALMNTDLGSGDYRDLANLTQQTPGIYNGDTVICTNHGGLGAEGARQLGLTIPGGGSFSSAQVDYTIVTELYHYTP